MFTIRCQQCCVCWMSVLVRRKVVGAAVINCVDRVFLSGATSGTLKSVSWVCTLGSISGSCCSSTLGSGADMDVASIICVRYQISCFCLAVTIGLRLRMLARLAIALMILSACDNDGFVMFLCLKWTVLDKRSLWVDLMWQRCVQ